MLKSMPRMCGKGIIKMLPRFQPRFRRTPHLAGLQTLNFTPYGFVFLDDFLFPLYPLGMNGERENSRLNTESERCFVLKENGDTVKTSLDVDFYALNNLTFDFGKILSCCTHGQTSIYQESVNCPIGQPRYGIVRLML